MLEAIKIILIQGLAYSSYGMRKWLLFYVSYMCFMYGSYNKLLLLCLFLSSDSFSLYSYIRCIKYMHVYILAVYNQWTGLDWTTKLFLELKVQHYNSILGLSYQCCYMRCQVIVIATWMQHKVYKFMNLSLQHIRTAMKPTNCMCTISRLHCSAMNLLSHSYKAE